MYKIIACDLDETLISRDRSISKENIEAIQRAKQAGVRFVPATGRGYNSVRNELKNTGTVRSGKRICHFLQRWCHHRKQR